MNVLSTTRIIPACWLVTLATASMSSFLTVRPSSLRSRFSSTTFIEKGRREMPSRPFFSAAFSEKYS